MQQMDKYSRAVVIDSSTQSFTYLIKFEMESEGCNIKESIEMPTRVLDSDFCKNIFSRPNDIGDNDELKMDFHRCFYGWHIGYADFERLKELILVSKYVDIFERLEKAF